MIYVELIDDREDFGFYLERHEKLCEHFMQKNDMVQLIF